MPRRASSICWPSRDCRRRHRIEGTAKVPPALLEEVFALNEELDEIREQRESGADPAALRARLEAARQPIDRKREEHERQLQELAARWDSQEQASAQEKRVTLEALRERLLERNYINNLLATIDREASRLTRLADARSGKPELEVSHVVGIDLGTTNSLVAYVKNGVPEVIRDSSGDALVAVRRLDRRGRDGVRRPRSAAAAADRRHRARSTR